MTRIRPAALVVAACIGLAGGAPLSQGDGAVARMPVAEIAGQGMFTIDLAGRAFTLAPTASKRVDATDADVVRGTLVGEPGHFVLASVDGFVSGAIWTEGGAFDLRPVDAAGLVEVVDIARADLPGCLTHTLPENAPGERPVFDPGDLEAPGVPRGGTPEQVVRVFVPITQDAVAQLGGESAALAVATASIESTNAAFANSQMTVGDQGVVGATVELAGTLIVDGQGLGFSALLDGLRNPNDGIMDEVHPMRDATKADLVALLSRSGIGVCGVAYFAISNPSLGFSVTAHSCAVGNLTFAHELGHNYGASHDAANAGAGNAPYAFGWRWNTSGGALRRSVMAYAPGSRRPHFSNPEVSESGGATGDAGVADNARFIGETTPLIANFRSGPIPPVADCDADGVLDGLQIALDPMLDLDNSGTLDSCDVQNGLLEDCNGDGVADILEIALDSVLDSDASGALDSCELAQGLLEDCNGDGIADIGQIRPRIVTVAEPIEFGAFPPVLQTVLAGGDDEVDGDVTLIVSADADVGAGGEYIDLFISGVPIGRFWEQDGTDCDPVATRREITFDAPTWASFPTPRVLGFQRPSSVDVAGCGTNSINASVEYVAINRDFDANADGVLDGCGPGCSIADLAEPFGVLDLADISAFVAAFSGGDASVDLAEPFGVFDLADVVAFVTAFGAGCP
jgi:hypothetical protein